MEATKTVTAETINQHGHTILWWHGKMQPVRLFSLSEAIQHVKRNQFPLKSDKWAMTAHGEKYSYDLNTDTLTNDPDIRLIF